MFIATDWSHYHEVPPFHPWCLNQHGQFFFTSPETSSASGSWILFLEEAVKTMLSGSIPPIL